MLVKWIAKVISSVCFGKILTVEQESSIISLQVFLARSLSLNTCTGNSVAPVNPVCHLAPLHRWKNWVIFDPCAEPVGVWNHASVLTGVKHTHSEPLVYSLVSWLRRMHFKTSWVRCSKSYAVLLCSLLRQRFSTGFASGCRFWIRNQTETQQNMQVHYCRKVNKNNIYYREIHKFSYLHHRLKILNN